MLGFVGKMIRTIDHVCVCVILTDICLHISMAACNCHMERSNLDRVVHNAINLECGMGNGDPLMEIKRRRLTGEGRADKT